MEKIKTGTTCIGFIFKDGIILGADKRMTAGYIASDKAQKVFEISGKIGCTMAGNAAANQLVIRHITNELKSIELKNERAPKVKEAAMMVNSIQYSIIRSQGEVVSMMVGGVDTNGEKSLYDLSPDGTIGSHDGYSADGSGSVWVKGVLDNEYRDDLTKEESLKLIEKCFFNIF